MCPVTFTLITMLYRSCQPFLLFEQELCDSKLKYAGTIYDSKICQKSKNGKIFEWTRRNDFKSQIQKIYITQAEIQTDWFPRFCVCRLGQQSWLQGLHLEASKTLMEAIAFMIYIMQEDMALWVMVAPNSHWPKWPVMIAILLPVNSGSAHFVRINASVTKLVLMQAARDAAQRLGI